MKVLAGAFKRFSGPGVSTNRKIFAASALIAVVGLMVKLVSLVNTSVVAAFFGNGDQNDCFVIAFLVPMTAAGILSGSLAQTLIPTYVEVREKEGKEAAERLFSTMLVWNTVGVLGLSVILLATDHMWLPLLASDFSPAKIETTSMLMRFTLPMLVIGGFTSTWGAVLNAGERFGVVAMGPVMQPTTAIVCMYLFSKQMGIYSLALGTVLGAAFEAILVGTVLFKTGHTMAPKWHGMTKAVRQVRAQYFACIAGAIVLSGTTIVDMGFAGSHGSGSNSALSYGTKIPAVFIGLMINAVGTAVLPMFSKQVAQRDWTRLRATLKKCVVFLMAGSVGATAIMIACTPLIVSILFKHGKFGDGDASLVSLIQRLSLLGAPAAITLVPVTRMFIALRANYIMSLVSVGSLFINATADYILLKKYGVPGIALATGVWMMFVGVVLFSILYFHLLPKAERELPSDVVLPDEEPIGALENSILDPYEPLDQEV